MIHPVVKGYFKSSSCVNFLERLTFSGNGIFLFSCLLMERFFIKSSSFYEGVRTYRYLELDWHSPCQHCFLLCICTDPRHQLQDSATKTKSSVRLPNFISKFHSPTTLWRRINFTRVFVAGSSTSGFSQVLLELKSPSPIGRGNWLLEVHIMHVPFQSATLLSAQLQQHNEKVRDFLIMTGVQTSFSQSTDGYLMMCCAAGNLEVQ